MKGVKKQHLPEKVVVLHAKQDICVRAKQDMGSKGCGEVEEDGGF
jgi:hypothetical protein